MPIPVEFTFNKNKEAGFISDVLIPLLHRLGFSVVVNYHGTREFGKDLVFGEIDRFGHIRYHGLQAKYVDSIGLRDSDDLIADCRQAFASPFKHPHTNEEQRINTFYAVNGGSISDQARTHFFNSLAHPHGGNVRLIDGMGVLALDRWAATNRSQTVLPDLNGLLLEIAFNRRLINLILTPLQNFVSANAAVAASSPGSVTVNPLFPNRLRINAVSRYLQRPFFIEAIPATSIEVY